MKSFIFSVVFCLCTSGCAWFTSPGYTRTVAVMPFSASGGKFAGQEAADTLGMELLSRGFEVIDRSTTTALVNEGKFYSVGINDEMRQSLQAHNIMLVFFGTVNEFNCETSRNSSLMMQPLTATPEKSSRCSVSVTAKMADTATGRLLWGVNLSDSSEGVNLTAAELMKNLIKKANLGETLPEPTVPASRPKWMALFR